MRGHLVTHGTVQDLPRSGRPKVTTRENDQSMQSLALENRFASSGQLHEIGTGNKISGDTVRRRLKENDIKSRYRRQSQTISM